MTLNKYIKDIQRAYNWYSTNLQTTQNEHHSKSQQEYKKDSNNVQETLNQRTRDIQRTWKSLSNNPKAGFTEYTNNMLLTLDKEFMEPRYASFINWRISWRSPAVLEVVIFVPSSEACYWKEFRRPLSRLLYHSTISEECWRPLPGIIISRTYHDGESLRSHLV